MKFRAIVLLLTLLTQTLIAVSCATLPPQVRPTTIEPFLGNWTGDWWSYVNSSASGQVQVEIKADPKSLPNGVIYNSTGSPHIRMSGIKGDFRNGELFFTTPWRAQLNFALYGTDRLVVMYFNPVNQDRGRWSLSRK